MKSKDTQFAAHVQKPANCFTCVSGAVSAAFATYTQLFRVDPRHQRVCANGIYGLRTGSNEPAPFEAKMKRVLPLPLTDGYCGQPASSRIDAD